jgi:DNA-binding transcriptional regulator YhcF (GntR family)
VIAEEAQVPSTNQLAVLYRINPATAAKGINILVDEKILYKKRGVGMFVSRGAVERIRSKRKKAFFDKYVAPMLEEASNLGIPEAEIKAMLNREGEE